MADEPDFEDIREFIAAQLAEDEAAAREAAVFYDDHDAHENGVEWRGHEGVNQNGYMNFWLVPHLGVIYDPASGRHIVRHNPAQVLREVKAKRRVLERHRPPRSPAEVPDNAFSRCCIGCGFLGDTGIPPRTPDIDDCPELRDLAAPFAGRPGYKVKWSAQ
jgi:hypothetical protein